MLLAGHGLLSVVTVARTALLRVTVVLCDCHLPVQLLPRASQRLLVELLGLLLEGDQSGVGVRTEG